MRERDKFDNGRKRGIYETTYGNAALVNGRRAKTAFDLDSGDRIPISEVTNKWLRKAEPQVVGLAQKGGNDGLE
jgi:hypothetical protein